MKYNNTIKIFVGILLSIIIIFILFKIISFKDIISNFSKINKVYLIIGFIFFIFTYILRAIRFKFVSGIKKLKDSFLIVCIHNFFSNILPAKLGELSYPIVLKKRFGTKYYQSFSDLILIRFFDVMTLGIVLFISLISIYTTKNTMLIFFFGLIIWIFLFFIIFLISKKIIIKISKIKTKKKYIKKIIYITKQILLRFAKRSNKNLIKIAFISLMITLSMFIVTYILLRGLNVNIYVWWLILGGTLAIIAGLIPIQSFLNLGTFEAGLAFPLILGGLPKEEAIIISFSYHIINIVFISILYLLSILLYNLKKVFR